MRLSIPRCLGLVMSAVLLVLLTSTTSQAATYDSGSISYPVPTAQAASVHDSPNASSSTGSLAAASGQNWASCVNGTCTIALNHATTQALISAIDATPKLQLLAALYALCNAYTSGAIRVACTGFAVGVVIAAPFVAQQLSEEDMGYGVYITFSVTNYNKIGVTPQPASPSPVPYITQVTTYTQGVFVYFKITYADPGHNAEGFGFVGVNGSGWAEENHPFSSPSYGIVGTNSIAYPFNQECGTAQQYDSYVEAWIYNTSGVQSQPVTIHLVCASTGTAG